MSVTFEHPNLQLDLRQEMLEILQAALVGADPYRAVRNALELHVDRLEIGGRTIDLRDVDQIHVVGAGKAGAPMAQAVEDVLGDRLGDGVVAVKDGYRVPTSKVSIGEAAHPMPDDRSLKAARAISHVAEMAGERDLVICLMSGGGSAVVEIPAGHLTMEEIRQTTAAMMASGISIDEINTVRKHLSAIKGGQLARAIAPARHLTVAVSDVVGNQPAVIASGPTVPDPTTYTDALAVIERPTLVDRIPTAVVDHLRAGRAGEVEETPDERHPAFRRASYEIVSDRTDAVDAASKAAVSAGYNPRVVTTEMEGEARDVGRDIARQALDIVRHDQPVPPPACLLFAGETTVTMRGRGQGGRNQELALAAAVTLEEMETFDRSVAIAAFATDGTDGPTPAAGAIVGPETVRRGERAGYDARLELGNNNSYHFLDGTGDLIVTGPTCNNVNDVICVLVG